MPRVLTLSDEAARDAAVAGAKAAGLAVASAAGLPVLPGVVVPVVESADVVSAATGALGSHGSAGRARLAVMKTEPEAELLGELCARLSGFSEPLIVRSSSPLEADGTWSGAFSSFHGITVDDLGTAVRGCWGSAFSAGVLDRASNTGTSPEDLGLAVLVQPELQPDVGGTAALRADGSVEITSTTGPLFPLMEGHVEGSVSAVGPDDSVREHGDVHEHLARRVAGLVRRVHEVLEHQLIEWAAAEGRVYLLQSLRSSVASPPGETHPATVEPTLLSDVAVRVAAWTQRCPGRLGHELVLPWAAALGGRVPDVVPSDTSPTAALAAARAEANALVAQLWGGSPRSARAEAERVLRNLRGSAPAAAIDVLAGLPSFSPDRAASILGHLETVRRYLRSTGVLDSDASFWRLGADELERVLAEGLAWAETRLGADRWEPFVHGVVRAAGECHHGRAAAPGAGAGRAYIFTSESRSPSPEGRYVIVAGQPVPALAPLLWNAAGMVTRAGSTSAHLIEFAHSIGVPTVVGCNLVIPDDGSEPLIAVDGDNGRVSVLPVGDPLRETA
ncbi:PEP-utilizing enzyme [Qaidamihabitans albus]|uniref:PEP-utilizing enzyme n=1 Tax=Qaidamihabitans albus TaxID=2795733 RepID=UPI0018F26C9E|nr:PEP-utilizing enzyme [Qaidamihabitans albus]